MCIEIVACRVILGCVKKPRAQTMVLRANSEHECAVCAVLALTCSSVLMLAGVLGHTGRVWSLGRRGEGRKAVYVAE